MTMFAKENMQLIASWLQEHHSNGVQLDLTQLMRYQRYTHLLDLAPRQTIQSKLAGSYLAKTKGRGMEFDEVRHYQAGDDVRAIDWRVTARTGKVHTKLFREEKERPVFILTDLSQTMQFGSEFLLKSVQAAHLAAMIAWHAKKAGDKLGGILFNDQQTIELKPAGRHTAVLRYLHQLIKLNQFCQLSPSQTMKTTPSNSNPTQSAAPVDAEIAKTTAQTHTLANALGQLRRLAKPGSLVFVISDFAKLDEQCLRHLQAIKMHNEIRLCQISDPLELQAPKPSFGSALVSNGDANFPIELADQQLWQAFEKQQLQAQQFCQTAIQRLGLHLAKFSAARPLTLQLSEGHHE